MEVIFGHNVNIKGEIVERTKEKYPYSYDPFLIWKNDYNETKSKIVYSDRLLEWDKDKFAQCSKEVWNNTGQTFYNRKPEEIEEFLKKYFEKEVKLTAIKECCNVTTGYPIWIFYYEEKEK